jgi:pimeloyl-ACP methyl ester carboxylesterase
VPLNKDFDRSAGERILGTDLYFDIKGDGEPLLLIPGFASGAWSWSWQVEALSKNFRVITFDPRGVGKSAVEEGREVSIQSIADDAAQVLDSAGIESAHVLGISFGGFVAQEFAIKYPGRLRKLILASTSFGGPNHVPAVIEIYAAFVSMEGINSPDRIRKYLAESFAPETDPEIVERFCVLRERNPVSPAAYAQQLKSAMAFNTEEQVPQITADTLIVTGDRDLIVPMKNSLNLNEKIQHSHLAVMPYAGHMAFVERADEFNRIVQDFLKA